MLDVPWWVMGAMFCLLVGILVVGIPLMIVLIVRSQRTPRPLPREEDEV